jgi:hypothetical protein
VKPQVQDPELLWVEVPEEERVDEAFLRTLPQSEGEDGAAWVKDQMDRIAGARCEVAVKWLKSDRYKPCGQTPAKGEARCHHHGGKGRSGTKHWTLRSQVEHWKRRAAVAEEELVQQGADERRFTDTEYLVLRDALYRIVQAMDRLNGHWDGWSRGRLLKSDAQDAIDGMREMVGLAEVVAKGGEVHGRRRLASLERIASSASAYADVWLDRLDRSDRVTREFVRSVEAFRSGRYNDEDVEGR